MMDARAESAWTTAMGSHERAPVLLVPYMWIGDFVRCHSVVQVLKRRWPERPVDVLTTSLTRPLVDYMPGVRKGVLADLPRGRLGWRENRDLARRLRQEGYGTALVMSRKWKAALAPFLAGIPERTGYVGEARYGLLNDRRSGERRIARMLDQCAALALPAGAPWPPAWPLPSLAVPAAELAAWRTRRGLGGEASVVALCPGAVGPSKRWPGERYAALAAALARAGATVWVLGGPAEQPLAAEIAAGSGGQALDLTGSDLRQGILALAAADVAISNDSGLLHVAAALGTPAIGIFGPTAPALWAPVNPVAALIETKTVVPCRPCHKPTCRLGHHACMRDIELEHVLAEARRVLEAGPVAPR